MSAPAGRYARMRAEMQIAESFGAFIIGPAQEITLIAFDEDGDVMARCALDFEAAGKLVGLLNRLRGELISRRAFRFAGRA